MQSTFTAPPGFSVAKVHETQLRLAQKIVAEDRLPPMIKQVAGVDVAYTGKWAIGAVAVLNYESLELLEKQTAINEINFPYIPTLLSFREIPPAVACIKKLKVKPDILIADGQGMAHPYRCGFASHLGLALGIPTIGVAKSRLFGEPKTIAGQVFLVHKGEIIGAVVTTKEGVKPVYVSVGNLISLETAVKVTKHCVLNSKIPEPVWQAHKIAAEEKRRAQSERKTL
jgi:deoxyribonuclease V